MSATSVIPTGTEPKSWRGRVVSPVVDVTDPDFTNLERKTMRLPKEWRDALVGIHGVTGGPRWRPALVLLCHSLDLKTPPKLPEGSEFVGLGTQDQVDIKLSKIRWAQMKEQGDERGQSLNTMVLAHMGRALEAHFKKR